MVILKKVKGSTLMETLVATVIIVIVFMVTSMTLNNLFSNTLTNNTREIDSYLNKLEYLYITDKLILPYNDDFKAWEVTVMRSNNNNLSTILFEAQNLKTHKTLTRNIIEP